MPNSIDSIKTLSFEKAFEELEAVVRTLEEGKAPLEQAIASYERGILLKQHCEEKLREATLKVEKILVQPNADVKIVPDNELTKS